MNRKRLQDLKHLGIAGPVIELVKKLLKQEATNFITIYTRDRAYLPGSFSITVHSDLPTEYESQLILHKFKRVSFGFGHITAVEWVYPHGSK